MIAYRDTWPSLDRLWSLRREAFRHPWMGEQLVCPTCSGLYTAGEWRAHRRSVAHRTNRGVVAIVSDPNVLACAVIVWRGSEWHPRREPCGKPAKGIRTTRDDATWPVCGIHLRARWGLVERAPGRSVDLREKVQP